MRTRYLKDSKTPDILTGGQKGQCLVSVGRSRHGKDKEFQNPAVYVELAALETFEHGTAQNLWCKQLCCTGPTGNSQERRDLLKSRVPGREQYDLAEK